MIVGTAGHIDHGKSSLVRALTGVETDRLKEEKARGISIELGFAYWPQPDGRIIGFVDVPGHEALVHTMLAGATGIDAVMLVVAADDGVMPQTREHLAIMDLLGLGQGVIVLNKCDLVDAARLAAVERDVRALVSGTRLADAPVLPVSAATGIGLDALRDALRGMATEPRAALRGALFRLAVDRAFTLKGQGTAATGMVLAGQVGIGDEIVISPTGLKARVRSIHAQNRSAERAEAGQRAALVLTGSGISKDAIHRGDMVLDPTLHHPVSRFDAVLKVLATEPKRIGSWFPVKVHVGASETPGRIVPLSADQALAGQSATVQIVLERPIAVCAGDRCIVRDTSSSRTIGGGVVLDVRPPERRRRTPERLAALEAMAEHEAGVALRRLLVGQPLNVSQFVRDRGLPWTDALAAGLAEHAVLLETADGLVAIGKAHWATIADALARALDDVHRERPDLPGLPRERLRAVAPLRLPVHVFAAALERLAGEGVLVSDRSWVRRPSHQVSFSEEEERLWRHILPRLIREPYKPPRVRDIAKDMDIDETLVRRLAKMAQRRGDVEEIAQDHFFTRAAVEQMAAIVRDCAANAAQNGEFSAADFRDRLDNGRKVAIQILEFFDRHGLTLRRKDLRRINAHRADLFVPSKQPTDGGVPLPVGRPDFKSGWGRQTASGGFDSHPPPPPNPRKTA
jgi:selenocysteine-specific elongation factor